VIAAYEDQPYMEDLAVQAVFGGIECRGNLPVTLNGWKAQTGITTTASRLKYTMPEEIGFDLKAVARIDSIINKGIADKAYPGCQLFAAKDGKVFIMKSYGHFTYGKKHAVNNMDLYDIASVTKIVSSAPSLMKMIDDGALKLSDSPGQASSNRKKHE
jgi:CubicO group peptidase (beta-lactamase class C family)